MTVGSIGVLESTDPSAKKLDTLTTTTAEGVVHREVTVIGDPTTAAALGAVMNTAPSGTEYGQGVWIIGGSISTAAKQDTGNASLSNLDTKTPALGQALAAASTPIVLTASQLSTLTPPAAITGFALEAGHLSTIDTKTPSLGQALAAASVPVVLTASQLTTLTPLTTVGISAGAAVIGHVITDATSVTNATLTAETTKVIGTVNQGTSPWVVSGTVAIGAGAAVIGHVIVDSGTITTVSTVTAVSAVNAVIPGTGATNQGKAEDAGHTTGDTGVFALAVRNDTPTTALTNANADYSQVSVDQAGVIWTRKRQLTSYTASYRLADATAGGLQLSFSFTANANKQVATIYHAAGSTKTVKLRKVSVFCTTMTASVVGFELRALSLTTAPATGNPAIIPGKHNPVSGAAEAVCLALPTTAGSLVAADSPVSAHISINAGATTASVSPATFGTEEIVLYEYKDGTEMEPLIMRAANAEGYAVNARSVAGTAQTFTVVILFTEE